MGLFNKKNVKVKDNVVEVVDLAKLGKLNYLGYLALIIVAGLDFYINLTVINIHSEEFFIKMLLFFAVAFFLSFRSPLKIDELNNIKLNLNVTTLATKITKVILILSVAALIIGAVASTKLFNAKKYASLIDVQTSDFTTDIVESENINDIALMDTESARIIGERAIGSLSDVVSQYEVSTSYSTIDYNGKPMKVASLEYAGFFKWVNNRNSGIPGYVLVDTVNNEAKYVELKQSIKYTPSGYFNDNLQRHLRFQYPTALFEGYYFELDNEGNPYYICPVLDVNAGLFGAKDVKGVVICDPTTGDSNYYEVGDVPNWVDRVYDGSLVQTKYDWYGTLSGGYWNSIIGNKGCKITTQDYGYKVMNNDVWVYTGVTSVNGDQSNIGFVMINLRTCESKYYEIAGAEEYSAMSSAQGQVQHLGYQASFPSLINIADSPTYIMVLKDNAGLVKMYALVNVEKYNIVATGTTKKEALNAYKKLLSENGIVSGKDILTDEIPSKKITIKDIQFVAINNETYVYIKDLDDNVYKQIFEEDETLILLNIDDKIEVYYEQDESGINDLIGYLK